MKKKIKDIIYFISKLQGFQKVFSNEEIISVREKELSDKITEMIAEMQEYVNDLQNDYMYSLKCEFFKIIADLKYEISFNRSLDKPIKTDTKPYNERAYSKLNYIFRKNVLLTSEEAKYMYDCENNELQNKWDIFLDLIDWLNDNELSIIPEKTLFSAFLGISVETYNELLKYASNNNVRTLFKSIDEYFTTNQFGALINNDRKSIERIQKTETYGQEMRTTQPENLIINQTNNLSYSDVMIELKKRKENIIDIECKEK